MPWICKLCYKIAQIRTLTLSQIGKAAQPVSHFLFLSYFALLTNKHTTVFNQCCVLVILCVIPFLLLLPTAFAKGRIILFVIRQVTYCTSQFIKGDVLSLYILSYFCHQNTSIWLKYSCCYQHIKNDMQHSCTWTLEFRERAQGTRRANENTGYKGKLHPAHQLPACPRSTAPLSQEPAEQH